MPIADWQLPPGVSRSVWEFAHDPAIARNEELHLAGSPLVAFDRQVIERWLPTPGRVVDLGCGTGRMSIELARRGWSVIGVDLSPESLMVASERARAAGVDVSLIRGNLCDLGFLAEMRFDAALLMFGTLGMVSGADQRREVVRQAHRLLRPGGKLALHVHNIWRHLFVSQGRRWLVRDAWRRLNRNPATGDTYHNYRGIPRMYHHAFTRREWHVLLKSTGMIVNEVIPLAADADCTTAGQPPHHDSLICRGWLQAFRATGWLILAERSMAAS